MKNSVGSNKGNLGYPGIQGKRTYATPIAQPIPARQTGMPNNFGPAPGRGNVLRESGSNSYKPGTVAGRGLPPSSGSKMLPASSSGIPPRQEEIKHREGEMKFDDDPVSSTKIVIHVRDENRNLDKDFKCDKVTLLSQMKYFEKFQANGNAGSPTALEDLDISVHCDIQIFEWLMKYLQQPLVQTKSLETGTVISILISADYLQMPRLVDDCVGFIKDHIQEVMKLPIDTNCISSPILKKLAQITHIEELDEILFEIKVIDSKGNYWQIFFPDHTI